MKNRKFISLILAMLMLLPFVMPAAASAENEERTIHIKTADDLKELARNCSHDTYSDNLTVELDCDIDLKNEDFIPIPVFNGVFEGNGHTVSGFKLGTDGSNQGFIRYIRPNGVIRKLNLKGTVEPDNSRCQVGGIAGVNYGQVVDCSFSGTVTGLNYVGGICGISYGIIDCCSFEGFVSGKRCTGGIAGYSSGVIQNSTNKGSVNIEISEGGVELDNISISSILAGLDIVTAEDSDVVSDTGGIAGYSQGAILICTNKGDIGYQHYGYNVGGIAGRQSYYISGCVNDGFIQGRKDVGGIVGQMEPYLILKTRNEISSAVNNLTNATSYALSRLSENAGPVREAMMQMNNAGTEAGKIIEDLWENPVPSATPTPASPQPTDSGDTRWDDLDNALNSMSSGMTDLSYAIENTVNVAAGDFQEVNSAASIVLGLLSNAVSGSLNVFDYNDISEDFENQDPEDLQGKVRSCTNNGAVEGDTDVGGIAGAMAVENEFDLDSSLKDVIGETITIDSISQYKYDAKCTAIANTNWGSVSSRKESTGGITGMHDMGTIVNCKNLADVSSDGNYVGGIAGSSYSMIDNCYSMCELDGSEYVGGIAGLGETVTDCATLVRMDGVTACYGAIAGYIEIDDYEKIKGNSFVSENLAAIDGISYSGYAEPQNYSVFATNEQLPEELKSLTLIFKADGKTIKTVPFTYGGSVSMSQIPAVPEKAGYTGKWPDFDYSSVHYGETIEAIYTKRLQAIESDTVSGTGDNPVVVLDGDFNEECKVTTVPYTGESPEVHRGTLKEAQTVTLSNADENVGTYSVRYLLPETEDERYSIKLFRLEEDGSWTEIETEDQGRYAGFENTGDSLTICAFEVKKEESSVLTVVLVAAVVIAALFIIFGIIKKKKEGKQITEHEELKEDSEGAQQSEQPSESSSTENIENSDDSW